MKSDPIHCKRITSTYRIDGRQRNSWTFAQIMKLLRCCEIMSQSYWPVVNRKAQSRAYLFMDSISLIVQVNELMLFGLIFDGLVFSSFKSLSRGSCRRFPSRSKLLVSVPLRSFMYGIRFEDELWTQQWEYCLKWLQPVAPYINRRHSTLNEATVFQTNLSWSLISRLL